MSTTLTLKIEGMTCGHCERAVRGALEGVAGVRSVNVDLRGGTATVDRDPTAASDQALVAAVEEEGYAASVAAA